MLLNWASSSRRCSTSILFLLLAPAIWGAGLRADDWPSPSREFRAAWVATVANIDWPSKPGLSTEQQKKELLAILDQIKSLRLNAVILQVRPMCDALYASKLEPWSEFLTGTMGQAPSPYYDPLEFAIHEAHARGLELHAWFNPYRAHHPSGKSPISGDHVVRTRPDLAKPYGKHHWLNPTNADVRKHSLDVIMDVVRRYDLDGIHVDDYFYPYQEKSEEGKLIPFPDDDTWAAYEKAGGKLSRDDWRRDAVNQFVRRMYEDTKQLKPWVKVGISPFGIWRPGNPPGIEGFDQYALLYADAKLWFREGWVDYYTPQLYWPIRQEKQSYPKLLAWWAGQNSKQRHLWPGNSVGRAVSGGVIPATELLDQIQATRAQRGATGNVLFSMKPLMRNSTAIDCLKKAYREEALVPASPWLSKSPAEKPLLSWKQSPEGEALRIEANPARIRQFVARVFADGNWTMRILPNTGDVALPLANKEAKRLVVTGIDRAGVESIAATFP